MTPTTHPSRHPRAALTVGRQLGAWPTRPAVKTNSGTSPRFAEKSSYWGAHSLFPEIAVWCLCCRQREQAQPRKTSESAHLTDWRAHHTLLCSIFCFQDGFYNKSRSETTVSQEAPERAAISSSPPCIGDPHTGRDGSSTSFRLDQQGEAGKTWSADTSLPSTLTRGKCCRPGNLVN